MSSYDDPQTTAHCNAPAFPPPPPPQTTAGAPGPDHIPRLHEAHPYWVLEQHGHPHHVAAVSAAARLTDERFGRSRPATAACWRPLPAHGIYTLINQAYLRHRLTGGNVLSRVCLLICHSLCYRHSRRILGEISKALSRNSELNFGTLALGLGLGL